jgi:hypothetical protein
LKQCMPARDHTAGSRSSVSRSHCLVVVCNATYYANHCVRMHFKGVKSWLALYQKLVHCTRVSIQGQMKHAT